jgi:RHS repeat-associated protein
VPGTDGGTTTFKYDPFGRRMQKSAPPATMNYLYDGVAAWADVIEEVDNNGNVLAKYTQQHLETDQPLSELRSGTASYFLQDGLGSVTSLSNSAGALANTYGYDSFGQRTASTGTLTNPFQYTGRDFDSETSLYYYRARYYDTTTGRFLNEDPIGFRGGIDFYAYVKNNPITSSDPTGQAASGGAGTEACDYYDKRCKAPCVVPKDSYACKAGQCCREFGTGPKQNCVRQCLIDHDRVCIQQYGNSLPSCRFYNHVVCYTSCGFLNPFTWNVSKSCLNIAAGR